jgi:peptidoglycan hydrolase-like protein with peptidoglycan-binding domain
VAKKIPLYILSLVFSLSSGVVVDAQSIGLNRTLRQGDRGEDVLYLQELLNRDADTAIASSGDGSPGMETTYFGRLTKQAIVRFQTKYRSEVLVPAGVSSPTGVAGAFTRSKLISLTSVAVVLPPPPSISPLPPVVPPPALLAPANQIELFHINPQNTKGGERVGLFGVGFSLGKNYIKIGDTVVEAAASSPEILEFTVPFLEAGKYRVSVSTSPTVGYSEPLYFMVYKTNATKPVITSISPNGASIDSVFTVQGSGFEVTGNTIHTLGGSIQNIPSLNGASMTFSFTAMPGFQTIKEVLMNTGPTQSVPMYVENLNGFSDPVFVDVNIQQ